MTWINPFRKSTPVNTVLINNQLDFTKKMTDIIGRYEAAMKGYQDQLKVVMDKNKEYADLIVQLMEQQKPVPYPDFLVSNIPYLPKVLIADKDEDVLITLNPKDIYTSSSKIKAVVADNHWKELYLKDKKDCAYLIWNYVIKNVEYELDKGEDWRYSTTTIYKQTGDCEDGTTLFLDLCHEAGFRSDEVFNAVGYIVIGAKKYCHSFPILNYGDGWVVYESTLNTLPSKPMVLIGSSYSCDYGLANWEHYGFIKGGQLQM